MKSFINLLHILDFFYRPHWKTGQPRKLWLGIERLEKREVFASDGLPNPVNFACTDAMSPGVPAQFALLDNHAPLAADVSAVTTQDYAVLPDLSGWWHGALIEKNPLETVTFNATLNIDANPSTTNIFTGTLWDGRGSSAEFFGSLNKAGRVVINLPTEGIFIVNQLVGNLVTKSHMKGDVNIVDKYGGETTGTFDFTRGKYKPDLAPQVVTDRVVPTLAPDLNLKFLFGGESLRVPVDIKNFGLKLASGVVTVSAYLSVQPNLGGANVLLQSKQINLNLAGGASRQVLLEGSVPTTLAVGGKYFIVTKVSSSIPEEGLANNVGHSDYAFQYLGNPQSNPRAFSDKTLFFNFVRRTLQRAPDVPATVDRTSMTSFISFFEGRRAGPYIDTEGHPSIGIGINLDALTGKLKTDLLADVRKYYLDVRGQTLSSDDEVVLTMLGNQARDAKKTGIFAPAALSDGDIEALFQQALPAYVAKARNKLGPAVFDALSSYQQAAVVSVTYNLGSLVKFPGMVKAFQQNNLLKAGFELVNAVRTTQSAGLRRRTGVEFANIFPGHEQLLGKIVT